MTDHFVTLGEPRRPWLDEEALKETFHKLSGTVHPDRVHGADEVMRQAAAGQYAELNAAHQCLREPKARLQHLIQLERGGKPGDSNQIPDDMLRLFQETGSVLRQADVLIAGQKCNASPMVRVQLMERALPCLNTITRLQSVLRVRRAELDAELLALDSAWPLTSGVEPVPEPLLQRAERLCHLYGFIDRWQAQLQDRAFQLTL